MSTNRDGVTRFDRSAKFIALALLVAGVAVLVVIAFARTSSSSVLLAGAPRTLQQPGFVTATATATERTTVEVSPTDGRLHVLFAGDSLTGGLYASEESKGFKWRMISSLEDAAPVEEYNSAVSGGTTIQVSEWYDVPSGLDLAVVELGTNDIGNRVPLSAFQDAYEDLLSKITSANPGVPVLCAGVWEGNGGGPEGPQYDEIIERACADVGGQFVPLRTLYQDPTTIGPAGLPSYLGESDDFHPNDRGHELIASALLERVQVADGPN